MNKDDIIKELSFASKKEEQAWNLSAENKYCPSVQVTDWWYYREGFPKDYDAYHPFGDLRRSSYVRLGQEKENESHWVTETGQSLEDGLGDRTLNMIRKQVYPRPNLTFPNYSYTEFQEIGWFDQCDNAQVCFFAYEPENVCRDAFRPRKELGYTERIRLFEGDASGSLWLPDINVAENVNGTAIISKARKDLTKEEIRNLLPSLPKDLLKPRYTTTNQASYKWVHVIPRSLHLK